MKYIGIVRKLDNLGRIVVPVEIRKSMGFGDNTEVEIFATDDGVLIRNHQACCVFCGSARKISVFKDKYVCKRCIGEIVGG